MTQLRQNRIFDALSNQIISIQTFDTGVHLKNTLYSERKVDGTLYGDQKIYRSTDKINVFDYEDADDNYNLLTRFLSPDPYEQAINIDIYKQIPLTVGQFLVKNAFYNEGTYSEFAGTLLSWIGKTKSIYEHNYYTANILVGAEKEASYGADISVKAPTAITGYDAIRWKAQEFYRQLEDNLKEMEEPSREYNKLGFMRTVNKDRFDAFIPTGILSQVRKHDVPYLFNQDSKISIQEIHWKFFGEIETSGGTAPASNKKIRSLLEKEYDGVWVSAGDLLPNDAKYLANEVYTATFEKRPTWEADFPVFFINKSDFPIMNSMETTTSFFNAKRLDMNYYLTFGHNNVLNAKIDEHPLIKFSVKVNS